jgi:hypothetical protein
MEVDNGTQPQLSGLMSPDEYPNSSADRKRLFPSVWSMQWYIRKNRDALIKHRALLLIGGRHYVQAGAFDACILQLGAQAAQRRAVDSCE